MAEKAVITRRGVRGVGTFELESRDAAAAGLKVEHELSHGTLVSGDAKRFDALEKRGYRVKLLPGTNLLRINAFRIDIARRGPKVPPGLDVPHRAVKTWPHHLVQLVAPPQPDWLRRIEQTGADVVEPVSGYGLFVAATPKEISAIVKLSFVAWAGLFLPAYRLGPGVRRLKGRVEFLSVAVYPPAAADSVRVALAKRKAEVTQESTTATPYGRELHVFKVAIDAKHISAIATLPRVRWIAYEPPLVPAGERETQIVAENLDATPPPGTSPLTGYQVWLANAGLSGNGVTIAIADTGVDANANNNVSGHLDLRGRQAAFVDYTAGATTTDTDGHGTNVAGIALGNAATGQVEAPPPNNFLWGQGMAPQARYVTQNFLAARMPPDVTTLIRDSVDNGAQVMNNSWGAADSGGSGYVPLSRTIDLAVRDPNSGSAVLEHLVMSCAAGNEGGKDLTISNPHESKNDIVVGNSLTCRPAVRFPSDDIRGIFGTSSRGPAVDGRILPTVVAPGTDVSSALSRTSARPPIAGTGNPDPANPGQLINQYLFMSGTSHSTAHVSGACALLVEWWRQRTGNRDPSPALLKALLVNSAEDLAGGENWRALNRSAADKALWNLQSGSIFRRNMNFLPSIVVEDSTVLTQVAALANIVAPGQWFFDGGTNRLFVRMLGSTNPSAPPPSPVLHARDANPVPSIPNGHQGWGRVSLVNALFQAPTSDRGPKIFSDQRNAFTTNGQEYMIRVAAADAARPLRITLVWTDAAGAAGANPALVNDLDLEVTETATGNVFKGNVFNNGFSVVGGTSDVLNNVECVYVQNPNGTYEVRVLAASISASARPDIVTPWQDFALVIDNAEVPAASPVSVVPVIDRSGSMIVYGYEAVTRISSKQFVDLMSVDDQLAVVSFGNTGAIEYPPVLAPTLQTITGPPVQAAANAGIDGMNFGGCTYMGDGIIKGRDLLAPAVNPRAMVLLSDGFDNKGCQPNNAARPSAMDAVATLPANLPVYTCAMGPTSDQNLLDQIASATSGRYYYMPTIDDLFEIYNYIRGRVSGDSIVANESTGASASRVGAFVDAGASRATFSVSWADTAFRYVPGEPRRATEVGIRLRDPLGRLLPADDSYVKRTVGVGYAIFAIEEPIPGRWFVEVRTAGDAHVRYTVGGFVRSPVHMVLSVSPNVPTLGSPLTVKVQVFDGKKDVGAFRVAGLVDAPSLGVKALQEKFRTQLAGIKAGPVPGGDGMPTGIRKLLAVRTRMLTRTGKDIFATVSSRLSFTLAARVSTGQFATTQQQGSYNVAVVTSGNAPVSGGRFVRKDQISVLVR